MKKDTYKNLVEYFGGQVKTATALGVTQSTVSYWVTGDRQISPLIAIRIEKMTKGRFKAVDLNDDLATELRGCE